MSQWCIINRAVWNKLHLFVFLLRSRSGKRSVTRRWGRPYRSWSIGDASWWRALSHTTICAICGSASPLTSTVATGTVLYLSPFVFFSTSVVLSFSLSLQNDDYSGVIVNGHWLEPRTCSSCFNFSCFFKWNWLMAIGKSYDRIFYCQLPFTGTEINSIVGRQQVPIVFFELELELKNRTFQQYVYLNHIFKKMKEKKSCKPQKMKSSSKKKSWW